MIVEGTAVVIRGDNIDTDVLYPGEFLNIHDPEQMKGHIFQGLDPSLRDQLVGDTVLVVDENFGTGSSREHVPQAMKASGIRCVLGQSFARIFQRNCVNLGLLVLTAPEAARAASPGASVSIDTDSGEVVLDGVTHASRPVPEFVLDMIREGGLVPWGRRRIEGHQAPP